MNDTEYKIFFGEWEITEFLGVSRYCQGKEQEEIIGYHIYYDAKKLEVDGKVVIEKPIYMLGLIPCKYFIYILMLNQQIWSGQH